MPTHAIFWLREITQCGSYVRYGCAQLTKMCSVKGQGSQMVHRVCYQISEAMTHDEHLSISLFMRYQFNVLDMFRIQNASALEMNPDSGRSFIHTGTIRNIDKCISKWFNLNIQRTQLKWEPRNRSFSMFACKSFQLRNIIYETSIWNNDVQSFCNFLWHFKLRMQWTMQ